LVQGNFTHNSNTSGKNYISGAIILGDPAYPLTSWLITAYPGEHDPNSPKGRFNRHHLTTRCIVERAFGSWKKRFYTMGEGLRVQDMELASTLITCAIILHNMAVQFGDSGEDFEPEEVLPRQPEINVPDGVIQVGPARERWRNEILNFFLQPRYLRQREE
jgi:hypothetical protein